MPTTRTMPEVDSPAVPDPLFIGLHDLDDLFMSPALLKITGRRTGRLSDSTITGIGKDTSR